MAAIKNNNRLTLHELRDQLQLPACVATLWSALKSWGIVLNKVLRAAEQPRPDVVAKRREWDILVSRQPLDR